MSRVIILGLDGFTASYAEGLMAEGHLPHLKAIRDNGTRFDLDHGADRQVGLAWEQFATGLSARDGGRLSPVLFDRKRYTASQPPTHLAPFAAALPHKFVVFDVPGFDILKTPNAVGATGWGMHAALLDGVQERPAGLLAEINRRFGHYGAEGQVHTITWHNVEAMERATRALIDGIDVRADIATWLLSQRLADWDVALIVPHELHTAAEALWHGVDPEHPLAGEPTAPGAAAALREMYAAIDRLAGRLRSEFPDAILVVTSLHGMGTNRSDLPSMTLLPELLYRQAFGVSGMRPEGAASPVDANGIRWNEAAAFLSPLELAAQAAKARNDPMMTLALQAGRVRRKLAGNAFDPVTSLDWMVAEYYRWCRPWMDYFGLPSFHDGRVRVNLVGRERAGRIRRQDYERTLDAIEALVEQCTDPATGRSVVARFERPAPPDPREIDDFQADLLVYWAGSPAGLSHPRLGTIGPLPLRRPGGHTGGDGMAWFNGPGIERGECGTVSAFDMAPTLLDLLGVAEKPRVSGRSRAAALTRDSAPVH